MSGFEAGNTELYERLGVAPDALPGTIKAAYRQRAKDAHPDRGGDADEFVALTMAYNTLMDPDLRKEYDLTGEIRDDHPVLAQKRLIENLATLLEHVIASGLSRLDSVDFLATMKSTARSSRDSVYSQKAKIEEMLKGFQIARKQIKRVGEEENIFLDIIDAKIREQSENLKAIGKQGRDFDRVVEELDSYETVVDIIRTVQAGIYPTSPGGYGGWTFINITPT